MGFIDNLSEELHRTKGYTSFHLKDFDETLYTQLKAYHNDEYYEKIRGLHSQIRNDFKSDVPPEVLKKVLKKFHLAPSEGWEQWYTDVSKNYSSKRFSYQFMSEFYVDGERIPILSDKLIKLQEDYIQYINSISYYGNQIWNFETTHSELELIEICNSILKKICSTFYPNDVYTDNDLDGMTRTCYSKGCFLEEHQDDNDGQNLCAILIYLNKEYDKSWGGYLKLHNNGHEDVVEPHFGNVSIIDFQNHSAYHEVVKVLDKERYALLQFMHKK